MHFSPGRALFDFFDVNLRTQPYKTTSQHDDHGDEEVGITS